MERPRLHEYHYILKNGEETTQHDWPDINEQLLDLVTGNEEVTFFTTQDVPTKTFRIECL